MKILNRKNELVDYNEEKLFSGIAKASLGTKEEELVIKNQEKICQTVLDLLGKEVKFPTVVDITNIIPRALIQEGFVETAEKFLVYATKHKTSRCNSKIDPVSAIDEYINKEDWRIKANANQGYSLGGMILNSSGKMSANYWLDNIYPEDAGFAHRNGDIHIHDLDMLSGYCCGWSLKTLLNEGLNGIDGKVEASAPKHLSAAIGQMVNFLGALQNEFAGAQAFSSFDTYLAPFVYKRRKELEKDYEECCWGNDERHTNYLDTKKQKEWVEKKLKQEVLQQMQEFIYNLNVPSRWGTQTPFTNVTFDIKCPEQLKDQTPMIGGVPVNQLEEFKDNPFTYGDLEKEMTLITQCYFEVMAKGDKNGRIFTFPIPTINIGKKFDWDNPDLDGMWEAEAKYGLAYFQNFVNSDLDENMIRSMCCRLQLDLHELLKRGNGLFGSAEQTGSIGVVTINCARLGYLSKTKEELYERLDILLELGKKTLEAKRKFLTARLKNGFYPFAKRYLGTWRNHFNTIGVNGVNEMLLNFNGETTATKEGIAFAEEFLDHIRDRLKEFQQETGNMYNLEATPGEGTCYRFAKEDKKRYPDIIQAGQGENIYYNNSSQLPVGFTDDIFEALELQENLQRKYTGGSVLHLFLGERCPNGEVAKNIIRKSFENFKLPYLTLTPTFSICPKHGYIAGEHQFCPICDEQIIQSEKEKCSICGE